MYAITSSSYRAISEGMYLSPDETAVEEIPASLLLTIRIAEMKVERSAKLRASDWTQAGDSPLPTIVKAAWLTYRQKLRDLPAQTGFPDVEWPLPPQQDGVASDTAPIQLE
jgi:hypothetical protein